MWKLRGSLFERRGGVAAIDSLMYMKMRALTSLAALKIKDTAVVPSACFRRRRQEMEQQEPNRAEPVLRQLTPASQAPRRLRLAETGRRCRRTGGASERKSGGLEDASAPTQRSRVVAVRTNLKLD